MRRSEFELELDEVGVGSSAARARLLLWFDGVCRELGFVGALRESLRGLSVEVVDLGVERDRLVRELELLGE